MWKKILFLLLSVQCFSQISLTDKQLKEDYTILKTVIAELSPTLSPTEKNQLYDYFNSKESELNGKSMSSIDFFRFLMDLKAKTKLDEHGSLSLPAEVTQKILTENNVLFPIPILIIDNKLVVNHDNVPLPFGSVIYELNDRPIEELLGDMMKGNDAFAFRHLEPSFDVLYLIKYGAVKNFKLLYTPPNSTKPETIWVEPIDVKSREIIYKNAIYPLNKENLRNVLNTEYYKEKQTYYIQLNSFNSKAEEKDIYKNFEKEFSEIFKEIKKENPKNVIIDLRYNQGGRMVIPALFYSYIAQQPLNEYMQLNVPDFDLPYKQYIKAVEGREVSEKEIDEIMDKFQKPFKKVGDHFENVIIDNVAMQPNKRAFTGNVYLLAGGITFSAASYFTALFRSENRGKIIGEQTGGSHQNITAGLQVVYELPNSKLLTGMPIGNFKFSDKVSKIPEKKIEPDIKISEKLKYQYLLKKEDWDLEEALKLME